MSYRAPTTPTPEKQSDPLINMAEMQQATNLQKNQRGLMSTYLQGDTSRYSRVSDYLRGLEANRQATLGSSSI